MFMRGKQALRRIPFEGIANFRDLGGYASSNGTITRWGVFFRSARLDRATDADIETMKALGIHTILDLRMPDEVKRHPDRMRADSGFGWQHHSLLDIKGDNLKEMMTEPDKIPLMSTMYQFMLTENPTGFRRLFEQIADRLQLGPVLFHCTAGKDRTGLIAMFLLSLCGVSKLDILADYQVSATYISELFPEDVTGSDPNHMLKTLEFLNENYGGPVEYLRKIGVSEEALGVIRGAFGRHNT